MAKKYIDIEIVKGSVMAMTEGISVTISMHNNGVPSFEQLWASDGEQPKLDIYYREAVTDLEATLHRWIPESTAQFDLMAEGGDYELRLGVSQYWPDRLTGVLKNQIQNYLVHAVTAGWLQDFDGLTVKVDYADMAASELEAIKEMMLQRDFDFARNTRHEDDAEVKRRHDWIDWTGTHMIPERWLNCRRRAEEGGEET